jgi:hypothetical protein
MGFFGSKKSNAAKPAAGSARKPVVDPPQSTRKSVRRVVPSASKGAVAGGNIAVPPQRAPTSQIQRPGSAAVAGDGSDDDGRIPPSFDEPAVLDLGSGPHAAVTTPARPASGDGSQRILASAAPDFSGSLGEARGSGPSRTGDQVLADFLTGKGALLTPEQASAARSLAEREGLALDQAAVRMGVITEDQLVNSLSQETWVPHLKVDRYEIRKKALDTIAREDAQHFGVFPVDKLGNLLTLAMVNPLDAEAIRQLEAKTGLDIKKVVATRGEVLAAIDKYYGGKVVASEGTRSFSQDAPEKPRTPTQMLQRASQPVAPSPAKPTPGFDQAPAKPVSVPAHVIPDISAEIQDIDDLLSGEETIAPAIIEPLSIKPEESDDALELTDAPITQAIHHESEAEFGLQEAPKSDTGALARSGVDAVDLEQTDAIAPPAKAGPRSARGDLRGATARIIAGNAGRKVANLVPVLEEEFRYAISHGKSKTFERWVALQSRNRIVNAVAAEKELDGMLAGLYAQVRKAG